MNEKLISGYTAFTTADEFGATPGAEGPGSIPTFFMSASIIITSAV